MADVEMSDAPAKKADGAVTKAIEGKKKFEVKKVDLRTRFGIESPY